MRDRVSGWLYAVLLLLTAAGCAEGPAGSSPLPTPSPTPVPSPKAVIISIDGLRPDAFTGASGVPVPNIAGLARRGAYTWNAQTIVPAMTLPAHSSMLSGVPPAVHGLTWDDWRPDRGCISVATVFGVAHAAGLRTVMVVGKEKFEHLNAPGTVDRYRFATNGDQDVADQAVAEVAAGFDLMFVHFPNNDFFGHRDGWMSETQIAQLARTDDAVARLLGALPPETVVIVTADHGGHGTQHGSRSPEDMTIPWFIHGPGMAAGHELMAPVSVMDTAATAAYVLGLDLPAKAAGRPVLEALEGAAPESAPAKPAAKPSTR